MKRHIVIVCILIACMAVAEGTPTGMVRVAAIQCPSVMGKTVENIRNITNLVRQAAHLGARVVVLPECSVQGYLDPTTWTSSSDEQEWPGRGHSCIITREGKVLAMSEKVSGNAIVIADLEINKL
jgi:predicted amidohydrolase